MPHPHRPRLQGGSDVVTRTALKRITWSTYKINQNSDKVCVQLNLLCSLGF